MVQQVRLEQSYNSDGKINGRDVAACLNNSGHANLTACEIDTLNTGVDYCRFYAGGPGSVNRSVLQHSNCQQATQRIANHAS